MADTVDTDEPKHDSLSKSTAQDPKALVEEIIEQRQASLRYFNNNFYEEFAELYRNIHARTIPHMRTNRETGESEEDHDRTNVCVPDHFVMLRRGTARLTRNPPNLRVRGGPDDTDGQKKRDNTAGELMFQWDRSESQRAFKKIVNIGYGLGWSCGKVYYDEVPIIRQLRKLTKTLTPQDFDNLSDSKDPAISGVVQQFGDRLKDPQPFNPEEVAMMVQQMGAEAKMKVTATKYKGPVLAAPFIGDIFPEAGFPSLNESGYVTENSIRDEDWLKYWTKVMSIDPNTGEEKPVMDEKVCQEVLDKAKNRSFLDSKGMNLRRRMREEIEVADPATSGQALRAPRKRCMIDERHTIVDGHLCIDFVGEEEKYLGRLWYPWETYGKYTYAEMVLIPDWLGGYGISTLGVTRFLMKLRNTRINQTTDFISNKLLPLLKVRRGLDITSYDLVRTGWCRAVEIDDMNDLQAHQDPGFPSEAWQDQVQYQQQMQQVDPSTVDFAPGTSDVAGSGKFATTAKLADKAADSVTADTLDQIGMFIRDVVEIELAMNQQAMTKAEDVPKEYFQRIDAESIKTAGGNARVIRVDPMDLQEIYEVLPEQGSTLAADDEFRVAGIQTFIAIGERHPDIVNLRSAITALARATPGINEDEIILPPPPPQPPVPPVKLNISLAIKWEELEPDVQAAILQHEGLPTELTHVAGVGKMIQQVSEASDHASNLEAPVDHTPQPPQPVKPNGKPPVKK
jgi:hypothetical protein